MRDGHFPGAFARQRDVPDARNFDPMSATGRARKYRRRQRRTFGQAAHCGHRELPQGRLWRGVALLERRNGRFRVTFTHFILTGDPKRPVSVHLSAFSGPSDSPGKRTSSQNSKWGRKWGLQTIRRRLVCKINGIFRVVAVREGFEPSLGFHLNTLSKRAPSTTRPPHHAHLGRRRLKPPSQEGAQYTQEGCGHKRPCEMKAGADDL